MQESTINQRIKSLVDHFEKGNKLAFSKRVGMSNQALGEIVGEKGSNPSFVNLLRIAVSFPEVSNDWLLTGEGEMLKSTPQSEKTNTIRALPQMPPDIYIEQPNTSTNKLVPLINYKAAANYLTGYQSQEMYEELEMLSLPREILPGKGRYIIFPVTGDSMEPTLWAEDLILCQQVRPERWLDLRNENLMVVVSRTHGIQVKRVKVSKALRVVHCRSDNPRSIPFTLSIDDDDKQPDVLELWMVEWYFSKRTEAPERQSIQRISSVETEVSDIRYLLESLIDEREIARRLRDRDRRKGGEQAEDEDQEPVAP